MTLTQEDTKTIKSLLDELKEEIAVNIDRKITTVATNIERSVKDRKIFEDTVTVVKLRKEIQASEDNLKQILTKFEERTNERFNKVDQRFDKIDIRFNAIDKVLDDIVEAVVVDDNERYSDHETRIKTLEHNKSASL